MIRVYDIKLKVKIDSVVGSSYDDVQCELIKALLLNELPERVKPIVEVKFVGVE